MRKTMTIVICLLPTLVLGAGWNGFPISTNGSDWASVKVDEPLQQLWAAMLERYRVAGQSTNTLLSVTARYVPSYSNQTGSVVSGSITNFYTNYIPIVVTLTNNLNAYNNTNLVMQFVVSQTNESGGVTTATAVAHLSHTKPLRAMHYALFWDGVAPGCVLTNDATDGTFNPWFGKTNGVGAHPTNFPGVDPDDNYYATGPRIFSLYISSNNAILTQTDSWGVAHGPDTVGAPYGYTRDCKPRSALLAESACISNGTTWDFRPAAFYPWDLSMPAKIDSPPVLHYQTTSATVPSVQFQIVGDSAPVVNWPDADIFTITNTVTVSGSNTPLTDIFYSVDSITPPGTSLPTGDCVSVVYSNVIRVYEGAGIQLQQELNAQDLNESQQVFNSLRWFVADASWYTVQKRWLSPTYGTSYAEAVSFAYTNLVYCYTNTDAPEAWLVALTNGSGYYVEAVASESYVVVTPRNFTQSRASNYTHDVVIYTRFDKPLAEVFSPPVDKTNWAEQLSTHSPALNTATNNHREMDVIIGNTATPVTNPAAYGTLDFPPDSEVPSGSAACTLTGWRAVSAPRAILKFDVTGGFTYY
jgi:hypothetical protein